METQGNKKNTVLSHWAYIWEKSVSEGYLKASLPLLSNIFKPLLCPSEVDIELQLPYLLPVQVN